ncbi:sensor histidine kinase [Cellvibrio fibrivorans]|uniref:histidine kinase n=1 Tax=Cellvibrio fibrivorans TaxID=126350 RepID=A0ABU1V1C9_9GAMM|nr:ATP-binding protein [Cellvibrio fibrivorans]MDR7091259.1 PAS domain S-box-containing protein [Cellvibrio fibrivorans]
MHKRRPFEAHLIRLVLLASLPLLLLLLWVMVLANISIWLILLTGLIGGLVILFSCYSVYQKLSYQFRSISNLLEALIQGDYTLRARTDQNNSALDELVGAINGLAKRLSQQRWESVESQLLLRTIIEHIDVAIIALNQDNQIRFLNPAAENLLQLKNSLTNRELLQQLAFVQELTSGCHQVVELSLGYQQGRFNVYVEEFREDGKQHKLLFITDIRTLLRSEERKAWQDLVRVISHEINNSLSPIASISQTLQRLLERDAQYADVIGNLREGLGIISERAKGLSQFVDSYKQLAKLPEPQTQPLSIRPLVEKIVALFNHQPITIEAERDFILQLDPVQFEQVLINLIKNAVESTALANPNNPGSTIAIRWAVSRQFFKLDICDQGSGISNPDNLFVPFYSTKKQGSGIGLVLCRQIIEAHNGRLTLSNQNAGGCCASIELPLQFNQS